MACRLATAGASRASRSVQERSRVARSWRSTHRNAQLPRLERLGREVTLQLVYIPAVGFDIGAPVASRPAAMLREIPGLHLHGERAVAMAATSYTRARLFLYESARRRLSW